MGWATMGDPVPVNVARRPDRQGLRKGTGPLSLRGKGNGPVLSVGIDRGVIRRVGLPTGIRSFLSLPDPGGNGRGLSLGLFTLRPDFLGASAVGVGVAPSFKIGTLRG